MDLNHLSLFSDVIKFGSFTAVASERDLDPSVVSRVISNLEVDLQIALFTRTTRKVVPTEAGLLFHQKISGLLEEFEKARIAATNLKTNPTGTLRITAPVSFGVMYLSEISVAFGKKYPGIDLELLITDSNMDLIENRIDVAIRFGHLQDSSLIGQKLLSLNYVVCASPAYIKKHGRPTTPEDLEKVDCLQFLFSGFNQGWKFKQKNKSVKTVTPGKGMRASSALTLKSAALADGGVALLPEILIRQELKAGKLVNLFSGHEVTATEFESAVWLLYPSRDYLPEKTKVFVQFCKAAFKES